MQKPFVSCQIYGQLGNQFFQIATTLAYAWDYGADAYFPALHQKAWNISYNKDRMFFRLNSSMLPRPPAHIFEESSWYGAEKIPFQNDLVLNGYLQSWKRFHHHQEKLLQVFAPSDFTLHYLQVKYKDVLEHPKTVGVHVRTQCRRTHNNGNHPFWGMDYYQRCIDQFPEDSLFVITSDRINWCKKHFSSIPRNFIFVEDNYAIEDLFLLAKCKHNILCNSSFSWWAAYFNQNPDKKVLLPRLWKNPALQINPRAEDFFLPEWTLMDCGPIQPLPDDVYDYDKVSQCIDNND